MEKLKRLYVWSEWENFEQLDVVKVTYIFIRDDIVRSLQDSYNNSLCVKFIRYDILRCSRFNVLICRHVAASTTQIKPMCPSVNIFASFVCFIID